MQLSRLPVSVPRLPLSLAAALLLIGLWGSPAHAATMSLSKGSVIADGVDFVDVTVVVTNPMTGAPIVGTPVHFDATFGFFNPYDATTDATGTARSRYTTIDEGMMTITAMVSSLGAYLSDTVTATPPAAPSTVTILNAPDFASVNETVSIRYSYSTPKVVPGGQVPSPGFPYTLTVT
jgi:hypothetical protein